MPSFGGSHSSILDSPMSSYGNSGGGGSWSSLHSMLFALGSNASGLAVVASTAPLAGLMLAMPSVGAGATCTSNDAPPGSHALTSPRGTPPGFSRGGSFQLGGFKISRQGLVVHCMGAAPSLGAMPHMQVSDDGKRKF